MNSQRTQNRPRLEGYTTRFQYRDSEWSFQITGLSQHWCPYDPQDRLDIFGEVKKLERGIPQSLHTAVPRTDIAAVDPDLTEVVSTLMKAIRRSSAFLVEQCDQSDMTWNRFTDSERITLGQGSGQPIAHMLALTVDPSVPNERTRRGEFHGSIRVWRPQGW